MASRADDFLMIAVELRPGRVMGDTRLAAIQPNLDQTVRDQPRALDPEVRHYMRPSAGQPHRNGLAERGSQGAATIYAYWQGQSPVSLFQILL